MGHSAEMTSVRWRTTAVRARLPVLLALAGLLLLAVVASRGGSAVPRGNGLVIRAGDTPQVTLPAGTTSGQVHLNSAVTAGLSTIMALALVAYLILMAAIVVMLASVRLRRARRSALRGGPADEETEGKYATSAVVLLRGAKAALRQLRQRAGGPPSDAVQQAWLVLEESAAECGTARRPEQTSTEFTGTVLAAHDVDPGALSTLRVLYQRARFGRPDSLTEWDAQRAVDALDRIADTLTVHARVTAEVP